MLKRYRVYFLLFFAYILIEGAVIGKGFYSVSADDSSRSIIAYNLLRGIMPEDLDWLPLHSIIDAGALLIYNDLFWTPRIISLIFGLLSIAALGHLSYKLFQNQTSLLLTALFALFYPPHIMFSAVPLTEIMFIFFITEAAALFISWHRERSNKELYLSALFSTLASGIRYEGWIFIFAFLLVLLIIGKESGGVFFKNYLLSFFILSAMPVIWMIIHYLYNGNPLYFFTGPKNLYLELTGGSLLLRLKYNFITNFIFQAVFFFIFPGLVLLYIRYKKDNVIKAFALLWGISLVIISILSLSGYGNPSHAFWRIPFAWTFLLIPFLARLLYLFVQKNVFNIVQRWILVLVPLPLLFLLQTYFLTDYSPFSKSEKHTGEFISHLLKKDPQANILIETSDWNYLHVLVASGQPERFVYDTSRKKIRPHPFSLPINTPDMRSFIGRKNIKYIVVYNDSSDSKLNSFGLTELKSFSGWTIHSAQ